MNGQYVEIDPMTTSFRQLKRVVGSTAGQQVPNISIVRGQAGNMLFSYEHGDTELEVFESGWCIYRRGAQETVFAADRCRSIVYQYPNGEVRRIYECDFMSGPCLVPLLAAGDQRLLQKQAERTGDAFRYRGDSTLSEYAADLEDQFIRFKLEEPQGEKEEESTSTLTKRQRQVYDLHVRAGLTQEQIARVFHLSRRTVQAHLRAAVKKV